MSWLGELGDIAGAALRSGVRVSVKTNLGPEFQVASRDQGGVLRALGIKAAVIVRDRQGSVIVAHGEVPPTNWIRAGTLLAAAALAGFLLVRGLVKA